MPRSFAPSNLAPSPASTHPYWHRGGDPQALGAGVSLPIALAHRGFARPVGVDTGLENSMQAFAAAIALGCNYLETDVHGTADGRAVALHDDSLDRTTDASGVISQMPWSQVRLAKIAGVEPVPLLEDILGTWPQVFLNIDVKSASGITPVAHAIERTAAHQRVCVTSFSRSRRRATTALLSRPVATSAASVEVAAFVLAVRSGQHQAARRAVADVDALQVPISQPLLAGRGLTVVDDRTVRAAHYLGKFVHVWTINDVPTMERLLGPEPRRDAALPEPGSEPELAQAAGTAHWPGRSGHEPDHGRHPAGLSQLSQGVDGIVTDRADLLKDLLQSRGQWVD